MTCTDSTSHSTVDISPLYSAGPIDADNDGAFDSITTTSDIASLSSGDELWDDGPCVFQTEKVIERLVPAHQVGALVVFDYDDTLFPTTFLAQRGYRLDGPVASPDIQALLNEYSSVVERTLLEAEKYGQVLILTNAEAGWISLTSEKFMPRLGHLLDRFHSISARSTYEPLGIVGPYNWKLKAFESIIEHYYPRIEVCSMLDIISIGDSTHERDAAHFACADVSNVNCKSVKFVERPDLHDLTRQHRLIQDYLLQIVKHEGILDVSLLNENAVHAASTI